MERDADSARRLSERLHGALYARSRRGSLALVDVPHLWLAEVPSPLKPIPASNYAVARARLHALAALFPFKWRTARSAQQLRAVAVAAFCLGAALSLEAVSSLGDLSGGGSGAGRLIGSVALGTAGWILLVRILRRVTARHRRAAILDERRRLARDLHDGVAQELAYIRMESSRMAAAEPDGRAHQVALAAEGAMEELRAAITALRQDSDEPFPAEVSRLAERLAARAGAQLSLNIDPGVEVDPEYQEPLLRIVREAVTNSVSHGRASKLWLELAGGERVCLAVRDNGRGFVPDDTKSDRDGFGLAGMRERAHEVDGDLQVRSRPGAGTEVEAVLP